MAYIFHTMFWLIKIYYIMSRPLIVISHTGYIDRWRQLSYGDRWLSLSILPDSCCRIMAEIILLFPANIISKYIFYLVHITVLSSGSSFKTTNVLCFILVPNLSLHWSYLIRYWYLVGYFWWYCCSKNETR